MLLIAALLTIWTIQWLYARRLISHRSTRHFFAASRRLRGRATLLAGHPPVRRIPLAEVVYQDQSGQPFT
jgi:hypothetical protein